MDRAVADVDDGFGQAYETRRRHREVSLIRVVTRTEAHSNVGMLKQRPGQPFWDQTAPQAAFIATLPEPLRIKASGLQMQQTRVYEDFGMTSLFFFERL